MSKYKVIILSHVVFFEGKDVFGPGHAVSQVLSKNKLNHLYVQHPLYNNNESVILFNSAKTRKQLVKFTKLFFSPFSYLVELFLNIYLIYKYNPKIVIAIDPLNAFGGIISKKLGFTKDTIFYTVDYAKNRFNNEVLNNVYHNLDKFAVRNSSTVWNTSTRIRDVRKDQGIDNSKNILVPNSPSFNSFKKYRLNKKNPFSLILMANFTPAIDYKSILKAIWLIKRKNKKINVGFIGGGGDIEIVRKLVKKMELQKNVVFYGFKEHDEALEIASRYQIGLAPYKKQWSWTEYGDSLKAREYLALGMLVIISDIVSTADDIRKYNAGYAIKLTTESLKKSIENLFNKKNAQIDERNAIKLAKDFDLEKIIKKELIKKYKL